MDGQALDEILKDDEDEELNRRSQHDKARNHNSHREGSPYSLATLHSHSLFLY